MDADPTAPIPATTFPALHAGHCSLSFDDWWNDQENGCPRMVLDNDEQFARAVWDAAIQSTKGNDIMTETPRTDFVENGPTSRRSMPYLARDLERELARLKEGIKVVLAQNAHLADGERCTLAVLKKLVPEWESEFLSNAEHTQPNEKD